MNSIVYVVDVHRESYNLCCYCYDIGKALQNLVAIMWFSLHEKMGFSSRKAHFHIFCSVGRSAVVRKAGQGKLKIFILPSVPVCGTSGIFVPPVFRPEYGNIPSNPAQAVLLSDRTYGKNV